MAVEYVDGLNYAKLAEKLREELHTIAVVADLSGKSLPADTDLLTSDLVSDFMGWFRLQIIPASDAVVRAKVDGQLGALNGGAVLTANCFYEFDISCTKKTKLNLQISVAQTPKLFKVYKVVV